MDSTNAQQKALEMIKAVADDGIATINGTDYEFTATTHKKRRKVFAFYTKHAAAMQRHEFSFLDLSEWEAIENLINELVLVDGVQISKRPDYWDKNAGDYLQFIATAMPVICYPFLKGSLTG